MFAPNLMIMKQIKPYTLKIEEKMIRYYHTLSEKERRRYAALEAEKLGYGGISYIARLLGCRRQTVKKGLIELESTQLINEHRIRKKGAGRKKSIETIDGINEAFLRVIDRHI